MTEDAKITFFKINKCGYYSRGGPRGARRREFGDLSATLAQIQQWVKGGVQLAQTQTYPPSPEADLLPAFVFDIAQHNGEWLLVLWNQTPAGEKAVASVQPNEMVGQAAVIENAIAKGSLPGFPSYYWFQPQHSRMAGVRFEFPVAGHRQLQAYLKGFLSRSAKYAVVRQAVSGTAGLVDESMEVIGYRKQPGDDPRQDVEPLFQSSQHRIAGDIEYLLKHHDSVRRVVRRVTLDLAKRKEDLALWQMFWRKLRGIETQVNEEVRVSYEMDTQITHQQIKELVRSYEDGSEGWDDVGFVLRGESSPRWIGKAYARGEFKLPVIRVAPSVVSAQSLLEALQSNRASIEAVLS
ncbi:hypothetical protein [Vandammella animalimorsus]|nr:hypothetical protein [Vandammella animalimorsus]